MKKLAQQFLSEADQRKIRDAVKAAEKRTSGEIVPMVVSASYHYPMADVIGATCFALPLALVSAHIIGSRFFWGDPHNMWIFLAAFGIWFAIFHSLVARVPFIKRLFVFPSEMDEEVREAAVTAFFREGLYRTRHETGILIFISVFEKKVWVLGDRGINEKVSPDHWEGVVRHIVDGIREKRQGDAICEAVLQVADVLASYFPVLADDTDELKNLIISD